MCLKQIDDALLDPIYEVPIYATVKFRLVIGFVFVLLRRRNFDIVLIEDVFKQFNYACGFAMGIDGILIYKIASL